VTAGASFEREKKRVFPPPRRFLSHLEEKKSFNIQDATSKKKAFSSTGKGEGKTLRQGWFLPGDVAAA